jgi:hypothetical protein
VVSPSLGQPPTTRRSCIEHTNRTRRLGQAPSHSERQNLTLNVGARHSAARTCNFAQQLNGEKDDGTKRPPRHFLYLDHEVAQSYLSDLLGWLPEEASSTDVSSDNKRKDWTLGYKGTGYGRGSGEEFSSEDMKRFRYTPESLFDHLFRELDTEVDGERMLIHLQSLDEEG